MTKLSERRACGMTLDCVKIAATRSAPNDAIPSSRARYGRRIGDRRAERSVSHQGAVAVWLLPAHRDGHKAKRFGYDDPKFSRKALLWKTGRN